MTLASALDTLAKTIKTDDGVFNAAIAEAAQRLREQELEIASITAQLRAKTGNEPRSGQKTNQAPSVE